MSAQTVARRVGLVEQALAQPRAVIGGGVGRLPFADQAEAAVDRDMVLVAEGRDGDVDRRRGAVRPLLRLGELHRPARVAILLAQLGGLVLPGLRNAAFLDRLLLLLACCAASAPRRASRRRSARAWRCSPSAAQRRVEAREQRLDRARLGRASRGTARSCARPEPDRPSPRPRNRMNDRRSLIRNSARSSDRLLAAWMTRTLNIITGSNGGRPPCEPSE